MKNDMDKITEDLTEARNEMAIAQQKEAIEITRLLVNRLKTLTEEFETKGYAFVRASETSKKPDVLNAAEHIAYIINLLNQMWLDSLQKGHARMKQEEGEAAVNACMAVWDANAKELHEQIKEIQRPLDELQAKTLSSAMSALDQVKDIAKLAQSKLVGKLSN